MAQPPRKNGPYANDPIDLDVNRFVNRDRSPTKKNAFVRFYYRDVGSVVTQTMLGGLTVYPDVTNFL